MTILTNTENKKRRKIQALINAAETPVKKYVSSIKGCPRRIYEKYQWAINPETLCQRVNVDLSTFHKLMAPDLVLQHDYSKNRMCIQPPLVIDATIPKNLKLKVLSRKWPKKADRTPTDIMIRRRIDSFLKRGGNQQPFTQLDFFKKFGPAPKCPLSGRPIDYTDGKTYHFDHIVPVKKGGEASLENLQLLSPSVNGIKCALTDAEYISLCREVVKYQDSLVSNKPAPSQ